MKLHLFAHNTKNLVKVGDSVKKYIIPIGTVGTANGQYFSHLHHSVSDGLTIKQLRNYINGWSVEKVKKFYQKPTPDYAKMFGRKMDVGRAGYDWLQPITNGSPHPGLDINGLGGGNSDIGYEYTSDCDGTVIYVSDTNAKDGWGKMVIVEENAVKQEESEILVKTPPVTPKQDEIVSIPVKVIEAPQASISEAQKPIEMTVKPIETISPPELPGDMQVNKINIMEQIKKFLSSKEFETYGWQMANGFLVLVAMHLTNINWVYAPLAIPVINYATKYINTNYLK